MLLTIQPIPSIVFLFSSSNLYSPSKIHITRSIFFLEISLLKFESSLGTFFSILQCIPNNNFILCFTTLSWGLEVFQHSVIVILPLLQLLKVVSWLLCQILLVTWFQNPKLNGFHFYFFQQHHTPIINFCLRLPIATPLKTPSLYNVCVCFYVSNS